MARYSLYAENKKTGNRILIKVKEKNDNGIDVFKEKVNLSTIDKYTLCYENEEQLSESLNEAGIINFNDAKIYIEYISKKQPIQIPIAYSNLQQLQYFATNAPIKVSVVDPKYIEVVNQFLRSCLDKDFLDFQIKKGYLHEYNAEYVREYVKLVNEEGSPRQIDRTRSLIYTELNRYKRIRGVVVGTSEYCKHLIDQKEEVKFVEVGTDIDPYVMGEGYQIKSIDDKRIKLVREESI